MTAAESGPDTRAAQAFEMYLVPTIFGPWSETLVDIVAPQPGERVLDVACGTGAAARYAVRSVEPGGAVAAIDSDPRMIEFARTRVPPGAVDWRVGDAQALPWEEGAFDAVVCSQGYQFFPDRAKALAEMHRVLKPDGRLALAVFCGLPYCPGHWAVARALEPRVKDLTGIRRPYSFGDPVALGDTIQAAGFREVAVVRRQKEAHFRSPETFLESLAAGGPSARHAIEQLSEDAMREVMAEVREGLAEYEDDWGTRIVTTANIAVARR